MLTGPSALSVPHTAEGCIAVHAWLRDGAKDAGAADAFFALAQAAYPFSHCFDGPQRLPLPEADLIAELKKLHMTSPDAALHAADA